MIEGWHLCREVDREYDVEIGRRHTLNLIEDVFENTAGPVYGLDYENYFQYWARALAFDALISNSDRHAENWAVVVDVDGNARMSALYDNGTSLGCQIEEQGLRKAFDARGSLNSGAVAKFAEKRRHHIRLEGPDDKGGRFAEICSRWLQRHPDALGAFTQIADVDLTPARGLMEECHGIVILPHAFSLSERRIEHMCAILRQGQERIRNVLLGRRL